MHSMTAEGMGPTSDYILSAARIWLSLGDIMNKDIATVSPDDPVVSAAQLMSGRRVSCVIAMEQDKAVGILTETDLLEKSVVKTEDFSKQRVRDIMSSPIKGAPPEMSVFEAGRLMEEKNIRRLPVMKNDRLLGIVTQTDLTQSLASYGMWRDVDAIMTKDVATVQKECAVSEAAEIMASRKISCVVVLDGEKVLGMLTERDCIQKVVALNKVPAKTKAEEVMTSPVISVLPGFSIYSATKLLSQKKIRRLVVMEDEKLCGVVTQTDIFRAIRKKMEDEEKQNVSFLDRAENSVFTVDLKGKTVYINRAFVELLEVSGPEELIGRPFLEERFWFNPKQRADFMAELEKEKGIRIRDLTLRTVKGNKKYITLFSTFTKSVYGEINGYQGMIYDLTIQKELVALRKAEEALLRSNEALRELNQLKSDLISIVSHELRTPITVVAESVDLLLDGVVGSINEDQRKLLVTSKNSLMRLMRMINNLLDVSKIESGELKLHKTKVNMKDIAREVVTAFELRVMGKPVELECQAPEGDVFLEADRDRIIQVITNLVGNALKFTTEGKIAVSLRDKPYEVECSIADTGMGISPENLEKVFDKFVQVGTPPKGCEKGSGLGLSIAKGIVEMHGGWIWVESELEKGTRFTFALPKSLQKF